MQNGIYKYLLLTIIIILSITSVNAWGTINIRNITDSCIENATAIVCNQTNTYGNHLITNKNIYFYNTTLYGYNYTESTESEIYISTTGNITMSGGYIYSGGMGSNASLSRGGHANLTIIADNLFTYRGGSVVYILASGGVANLNTLNTTLGGNSYLKVNLNNVYYNTSSTQGLFQSISGASRYSNDSLIPLESNGSFAVMEINITGKMVIGNDNTGGNTFVCTGGTATNYALTISNMNCSNRCFAGSSYQNINIGELVSVNSSSSTRITFTSGTSSADEFLVRGIAGRLQSNITINNLIISRGAITIRGGDGMQSPQEINLNLGKGIITATPIDTRAGTFYDYLPASRMNVTLRINLGEELRILGGTSSWNFNDNMGTNEFNINYSSPINRSWLGIFGFNPSCFVNATEINPLQVTSNVPLYLSNGSNFTCFNFTTSYVLADNNTYFMGSEILQPTGTINNTNFNISLIYYNRTSSLDTCYYNITNSSGIVEGNTILPSCSLTDKNFTSTDNYTINVYSNTTIGYYSLASSTFYYIYQAYIPPIIIPVPSENVIYDLFNVAGAGLGIFMQMVGYGLMVLIPALVVVFVVLVMLRPIKKIFGTA